MSFDNGEILFSLNPLPSYLKAEQSLIHEQKHYDGVVSAVKRFEICYDLFIYHLLIKTEEILCKSYVYL